jgi:hypothetical protein
MLTPLIAIITAVGALAGYGAGKDRTLPRPP